MIYIRESRLGIVGAMIKAHIVAGGNLSVSFLQTLIYEAGLDPMLPAPGCILCGKPYWSEEEDAICGCPWLALLGGEDTPRPVGNDEEESE